MAAKASCQVTIADITDAYSVVLTSETYTFMGNTSGAPIGSACTTQAIAYQGDTQCSKVTIGTISCPTGISASVSNNGMASPTITFKTTAVISTACEASVPVIIDGITIYKKFSFAVANQGAGFGWNLLQNTSGEWSDYWQPYTGTNICKDISSFVIPDGCAIGETFTTSIEIEWTGFKSSSAGTFALWSQGSQDGTLTHDNPFANGLFRITSESGKQICTLTKKWDGSCKKYIISMRCDYSNGEGKIRWRCLKIEKGTKATEWTPHPDDLIGDTGKGIKSTAITYQASTSGTTVPTGTWSGSIPTVSAGQYLWVRTIFSYSDNTTSTIYSVSRMGANGATGTNGKSIGSVVNYYLATASSSGVTVATSGWTTAVQSVSAAKKYLWNYEVVKYTDGTVASTTAPCIIGSYGDRGSKGDKGDTGSTGNGIKSITEHYAVSTSNSSAPTTWSTTVPTMTETNKYLWNYETITYTNNTTNDTAKRVIGVYGNKGATGEDGPQGPQGAAGKDANQVVHTVDGNGESNLYVEFATIKITGSYANQPTTFKLGGRGFETTDVQFSFISANNSDPGLDFLRSSGEWSLWIYKKTTSTWGLITRLNESWGHLRVFNYTQGSGPYTVTWTSTKLASLPSGSINANPLQAARTATNFMEFTSGNGLQIGNKTDGSWSGYRTKISASAFEILNQTGTTLAYYGDKLIQLGKNAKDSVIELCGGLGKIQSKQYSGYQACEMSSDFVALRSTHQAVLSSSTSTGNCMVAAAENTFGATATTTDSTGKTTKQGDIDISDGVVEFSSIRNGYDCTVGVYAGGWSGGTYRGSFSPSKGYTEKVLLGDNGAGQLWDRLMAKNATQIMSDRREKFDIKPLGPDVESQIATMSLDSEHSNANPVDIHSELFDRLQPVQYKMVNDDQRIRFGFVAQDVVDAMKELGIREDELDLVHHDQRVTENGYNDTYGMVYTNLIALVTHELQLEKQRRSNLEIEVADLRSELESMRDNISGDTN